jgi:1,4-alpha-glucan branching enzyme
LDKTFGLSIAIAASEATWTRYRLGFPGGGFWKERFNSDIYDHWVNPQVAGNGGDVFAQGRGVARICGVCRDRDTGE